ncbi:MULTISPECIES: hypothetical protein [Photorhabdus]|uniref:hypothetical protein n=1 Tax=Photorhabdus TaxID=29487 RepID=UPI0003239D1E|nr:hypothetical protein [Photorhabdus asymbiotica]
MLKPQQLFLVREPVDMRRGIDALTQHLAGLNLRWDRHGVWLCTRRLHRAQFDWLIRGIH